MNHTTKNIILHYYIQLVTKEEELRAKKAYFEGYVKWFKTFKKNATMQDIFDTITTNKYQIAQSSVVKFLRDRMQDLAQFSGKSESEVLKEAGFLEVTKE